MKKRLKNLLKGQKHHQFEKFVEKKDLGVYLPWEHIDNPKQYSKTKTDSQAVEPDLKDINFVPGSQSDPLQWEHKIHDYQRMKAYIATRRKSMRSYSGDEWYIKNDRGSNKPNWLSSKEYVMEKLDDAYTQKNQRKSAFSLGSALHVLEDFFAHSNSIEIMLIRLGERLESCDSCSVSGCFCQQFKDTHGSWVEANLPTKLKRLIRGCHLLTGAMMPPVQQYTVPTPTIETLLRGRLFKVHKEMLQITFLWSQGPLPRLIL